MAKGNPNPSKRPASDESNLVESGEDRSRPAPIPESSFIGGGRRGVVQKRPVQEPVEREPENEFVQFVEFLDELDELDEESGDTKPKLRGREEDAEDEQASEEPEENEESDGDEPTDDELLDLVLNEGIAEEQDEVEKPGKKAPKTATEGELRPEFKAEYDAVVEQYGEELADAIIKPRLLREQALEDRIAPVLQYHARAQQEQAAKAEAAVVTFFKTQASSGYAKLYGTGNPEKATPLQKQVMSRTLSEAVRIRERALNAGINITPERALQRAHDKLWSGSKVGERVKKTVSTLEKRSENFTMSKPKGGLGGRGGGAAGRGDGDPYEKAKQALRRAGYTSQ